MGEYTIFLRENAVKIENFARKSKKNTFFRPNLSKTGENVLYYESVVAYLAFTTNAQNKFAV